MKQDKLGKEIREALMDLAEEQDEGLKKWEEEHPEEGRRLQEIADQMYLRITKPCYADFHISSSSMSKE